MPSMLAAGSAPGGARRPPGRARDLKVLLAMLPAIVVVPLLVFAGALFYLVIDHLRADVERDQRQDARMAANAIERELGAAAQLLTLLAQAPLLQADRVDLDRFELYARDAIGPVFRFQSVALVDRAGRRLVDTATPLGQQWVGPLRPHHEEVFRSAQPVVSKLYNRVEDGRLAISVNVPVSRDGQVAWVLSAALSPEHFLQLLPEREFLGSSVASLIDEGDRLVARSRGAQKWVGRSASPEAIAAFRASPTGTARFRNFEGEPFLWSWRTLSNGWVVYLGMPQQLYQAPLHRTLAWLGAAGAAALLLGVGIAVLLASRIDRAVHSMARGAPKLLRGRGHAHRPSGVRQLDHLWRIFESAGRRIAVSFGQRERAFAAERAARAEAEAANRAKDEFLAMLSHELRNPLAPVVNTVKLLTRTEPLTARGKAAAAMIERQIGQLARLVDDLVEATRVTKGKIRLDPARVDVAAIARQAAEVIAVGAGGRSPTIAVSVAPGVGEVLGDAVRIKQVIENLLANAVKFSRRGDGPIDLDVGADGDDVVVRVRDRGIGIAPEHLARVFELFTQIDVTIDRAQGGLGVGLALVRALVRMHGGTVTAQSGGLGQGATFTVRLPRNPPPDAPISRGGDASLAAELQRPLAPARRLADRPPGERRGSDGPGAASS